MSKAVPLGVLIAGAACGDPLVGPGFHGEPLVQIEGRIVDYRLGTLEPSRLRASVAWSLSGDTTSDADLLVEQREVAVAITFPTTFTINIFEEPDDPRLTARGRPYLVGEIIVYEDVDQDSRYSRGELRGGADANSVLFAKRAVPPATSPTGIDLPSGFSLVELPLPCVPRLSSSHGTGNHCGVPLGAACDDATDCGANGHCLSHDGYVPYPGGYCVLREGGCIPAEGVELYVALGNDIGEVVWVKACQHPADCRKGYECAAWLGACMPRNPVFIQIGPAFEFLPLCNDKLE